MARLSDPRSILASRGSLVRLVRIMCIIRTIKLSSAFQTIATPRPLTSVKRP